MTSQRVSSGSITKKLIYNDIAKNDVFDQKTKIASVVGVGLSGFEPESMAPKATSIPG